jgi:hypothetical protein
MARTMGRGNALVRSDVSGSMSYRNQTGGKTSAGGKGKGKGGVGLGMGKTAKRHRYAFHFYKLSVCVARG